MTPRKKFMAAALGSARPAELAPRPRPRRRSRSRRRPRHGRGRRACAATWRDVASGGRGRAARGRGRAARGRGHGYRSGGAGLAVYLLPTNTRSALTCLKTDPAPSPEGGTCAEQPHGKRQGLEFRNCVYNGKGKRDTDSYRGGEDYCLTVLEQNLLLNNRSLARCQ